MSTAQPSSNRASSPALAAGELVSVRVSPHGYLSAMLTGGFVASLSLYFGWDAIAVILLIVSWIALPLLAHFDRITFDGRVIARSGLLFRMWSRLMGQQTRLRINQIEQVDTQNVRAIRRSGRTMIRYRTTVRGRGLAFAIISGGEAYRRVIAAILPLVPSELMDFRSIDLRDHLSDAREVEMKASFAEIPSAEVLRQSLAVRSSRIRVTDDDNSNDADRIARSVELAKLGNELRVAGSTLRSLEVFRRALLLTPKDPQLLVDLARSLYTYGYSTGDVKLQRRALAAFRLAERRPDISPELLARIGEIYLQLDRSSLAESAYRRGFAAISEGTFLAARGLAEIALRQGKIAHVIHNFARASEIASNGSVKRWMSSEAQYFSHLNSDENYLELEVSRVQLLDRIESIRRSALRIMPLMSVPLVFGLITDDELITEVGWLLCSIALATTVGSSIAAHFFRSRIPYEMTRDEE